MNDVYKYSVKRIKKKINDFILNNYHELFFTDTTPSKASSDDAGTSEDSPKKEQLTNPAMAAEFQTKLLTPADFIKNTKILLKAQEELQFCDEQGHTPQSVI